MSFQHFQQVVNISEYTPWKTRAVIPLVFPETQKNPWDSSLVPRIFPIEGSAQDSQMFQEDLQADEDQDHTAAQFRLGLEAAAEYAAHAHAHC